HVVRARSRERSETRTAIGGVHAEDASARAFTRRTLVRDDDVLSRIARRETLEDDGRIRASDLKARPEEIVRDAERDARNTVLAPGDAVAKRREARHLNLRRLEDDDVERTGVGPLALIGRSAGDRGGADRKVRTALLRARDGDRRGAARRSRGAVVQAH